MKQHFGVNYGGSTALRPRLGPCGPLGLGALVPENLY